MPSVIQVELPGGNGRGLEDVDFDFGELGLEARHEARMKEAVATVEKQAEVERKAQMVAFEENLDMWRKRYTVMYLASAELGGRR